MFSKQKFVKYIAHPNIFKAYLVEQFLQQTFGRLQVTIGLRFHGFS